MASIYIYPQKINRYTRLFISIFVCIPIAILLMLAFWTQLVKTQDPISFGLLFCSLLISIFAIDLILYFFRRQIIITSEFLIDQKTWPQTDQKILFQNIKSLNTKRVVNFIGGSSDSDDGEQILVLLDINKNEIGSINLSGFDNTALAILQSYINMK